MAKAPMPRRGEVWLVDFDPAVGAEIQKLRPAVVITMDAEAGDQARRPAGALPDRHAEEQSPIANIEVVKGPDRTAPIVLAATVEGFE